MRIILTLLILLILSVLSIEAGGWFHSEPYRPVDTNVGVVVTMNDDGTITATYRFNFYSEADDFVWIVPLPSEPLNVEHANFDWNWVSVSDVSPSSVSRGQYAPRFTLSNTLCNNLVYDIEYGYGGRVYQWGEFASAEHHVFNYSELTTWLATQSIVPSEPQGLALEHYQSRNMIFLAFKMENQIEVRDDRLAETGFTIPISITYKADTLV